MDNTRPDGSIKQIFGANPRGIAVFDAHGSTVVVLMRSHRAKFAAAPEERSRMGLLGYWYAHLALILERPDTANCGRRGIWKP